MMLICGCDVYKRGMKGVKVKTLAKLIESLNASSEAVLYEKLYAQFQSKNKLTNEVIDTYIDAILYEPTSATPSPAAVSHCRAYLFGPPTRLPKYLEEFSPTEEFKQSHVFPGPEICHCKGLGDGGHLFL
jgi:hypothetical protein